MGEKAKRKPKFGVTGKFPDGDMGFGDEGEIQFGVANNGSEVILSFGKPVAWLGMPPQLARQFAELLTKHADSVERKAH